MDRWRRKGALKRIRRFEENRENDRRRGERRREGERKN